MTILVYFAYDVGWCLPFIGRVNEFKSGDINEDLMSGVDNEALMVVLTPPRRGEELC